MRKIILLIHMCINLGLYAMDAAETHEDHQTANEMKCNAYDALRIQTENA